MIQLKQFLDLMEQLREGNGLDREARSLYTVTLRAQDGPGGLDTYTSVSVCSSLLHIILADSICRSHLKFWIQMTILPSFHQIL